MERFFSDTAKIIGHVGVRVIDANSTMPSLLALEARTKSSWPSIHASREDASAMRLKLTDGLKQFPTKDANIVVVGSLARQEFTQASDVDWMLLVDGLSDPKHLDVVHSVREQIAALTDTKVGPEGYFGTLCASHDLVQHIGGQEDTNANTTRRILLLLESISIGREEAHQRVLKNILFRYLDEDRGLWHGSSQYKVPRFMFNDISRYWRTMAVDFPYKQRTRPGGDFALKNFKLRLSRKLIYLAGMLACFECHLGFASDDERAAFYSTKQVQPVIGRVHSVLSKPPLEIVATALLAHESLDQWSKALFGAYDEFLEMLRDEEVREKLKSLPLSSLDEPIAARYRDVAHRFMVAIRRVFLTPSNQLGQLTIEYGVF